MFEIVPFAPEVKVKEVEIAALKTCKTCERILPARHENFHSAGIYKGRQQFKSECKVCSSEKAQQVYQAQQAPDTALQQALEAANKKVELAFEDYKLVRLWFKDGLAPESYKLDKLRDYVEAQKILKLIQNAMPPEPESVTIHIGEYENFLELYEQMEGKEFQANNHNRGEPVLIENNPMMEINHEPSYING